jgi:hypothetical protein
MRIVASFDPASLCNIGQTEYSAARLGKKDKDNDTGIYISMFGYKPQQNANLDCFQNSCRLL